MLNLIKSIVAIFTVAFSAVAPEAPAIGAKEMEGKALPAFEMTTVEGKRFTNSTAKGKPMVIDFWASWCGPCKSVAPVLQELHTKYAKDGLIIVGANGREETAGPGVARSYAKTHKYGYTFTHTNDALMKDWGINGVPTLILVDRSGKVVKVQIGYADRLKPRLVESVASLVRG